MSLRAFLAATLGTLALLTLVAASSLVILTSVLDRRVSFLASSVEGVRLAEELELDLLTHARLSGVTSSRPPSGTSIRGQTLESIEASFPGRLQELNRNAITGDEHALLSEVDGQLGRYLTALRESAELPPRQRVQRVVPELDATLDSLERLVQLNVDESRQAQASASRWSRLADTVGLSLVALLLVGAVATTLWLRRFAFRPLREISVAMRRFGSGRKRTRAPEAGPAELRDMARTFNEMANSLAHQQEQQLAFLAGVAHELRNPLSALKLSTALSDRPGTPPTPERTQRTLALVRRQVDRLDRMVGDLLDASRIEAGKLELRLEVRDARDLIREVVELYRSGDTGHVLQLSLPDTPVPVRADPARLEQVMSNLVSNALKYSPAGSRVEVAVRTEGDEAVLSVRDQGIGISADERRLLFAPFQRAGNARQRAPGVGLGLSVARRIVEAHGGNIEVESRPGAGSIFRIRLALAPALAHAPDEVTPPPPDALH